MLIFAAGVLVIEAYLALMDALDGTSRDSEGLDKCWERAWQLETSQAALPRLCDLLTGIADKLQDSEIRVNEAAAKRFPWCR